MSDRRQPIEAPIDVGATKSVTPETGDDKEAAPIPSISEPEKAESRRAPPIQIDEIPPAPIRTVPMPWERAHMLATLPRSRLSDMFWPAITGLAGSASGTLDAIEQALKFTQKASEQNQIYYGINIYGMINLATTIIFFTLLIVSLFASWWVKTSSQYLNEIYNPSNAKRDPRRLRFARWILKC